MSDGLTRSQFVRAAAGAAAGATVFGGGGPAFAGPLRHRSRELKGSLSILQWKHVVAGYDAWFDKTWAATWGEQNDVQVDVDHLDKTKLAAQTSLEASKQHGHDIVGFLSPPATFANDVIDHTAVVAEIERRVGTYSELGRRSTYDPRSGTHVGVCDFFAPSPAIWRHDLWNDAGESPATWDDVAAAAPRLLERGHPVGIGQSSAVESSLALLSIMLCFGGSLQDESDAPRLNSKETIAAVKFMADLFRRGGEQQLLDWNDSSNNAYLLGGRGSLILNAISAVRTAEALQVPFLDDLWIWPIPAGPAGRLGSAQTTGVYSIWKFAKNPDAAEKFIADFCSQYEQATLASKLFNYPGFPGAFPASRLYPAAAADPNPPHGKYTILTTVASRHTCNVGYPGTANPAVMRVVGSALIPTMFARVAQGRATAEESVQAAAAQARRLWAQ